jgi:hypothetical protein
MALWVVPIKLMNFDLDCSEHSFLSQMRVVLGSALIVVDHTCFVPYLQAQLVAFIPSPFPMMSLPAIAHGCEELATGLATKSPDSPDLGWRFPDDPQSSKTLRNLSRPGFNSNSRWPSRTLFFLSFLVAPTLLAIAAILFLLHELLFFSNHPIGRAPEIESRLVKVERPKRENSRRLGKQDWMRGFLYD